MEINVKTCQVLHMLVCGCVYAEGLCLLLVELVLAGLWERIRFSRLSLLTEGPSKTFLA